MNRLYSILMLCLISTIVKAQTAASYTFSQTNGTYTPIVGTTIFSTWDDNTITNLPIGFTFNYCGLNYTTFALNANGYIGFGTVSYSYDPLNTGVKIISGFGNDIYYNGPGYGPLVYSTTGTSPNRVLTIQWNNFCHYSTSATGPLNMQIKLFEGSNIISVVYGNFSPTSATLYTAVKVGIKGNTSADYNTRTTTSNWAATTAGTNTSSCYQSNTIKPSNGLTFSWCPPAPAITGVTSTCVGSTTTLFDASAGGTWTSSNPAVATVGISTGIVTGVAVGSATITYTPSCGSYVTTSISVGAAPSAITGASTVCTGLTTTLINSGSGGTWTSSNTAIATVDGVTGVVTGVSSGSVTITYTMPAGCFVTKVMTVNSSPAAITGTSNVCVGLTTTLSDATPGGTWSSSDPALAVVGSASGIVSGIASGNPTISYTAPTGCSSTVSFAVNPIPGSITGASTVCETQTTILSSSSPGGSWTSNDTAVANIDLISGVAAGVSAGNTTITYTLFTGCLTTRAITVNPLSLISGTPSVCIGYSTVLSDATPGGIWSSSNPGVATVSSGVVSSVSLGSTTISYAIPATGCTATQLVNVTNPPTAYSVTGGGPYCSGGTGAVVGLSGSDPGIIYQLYNYSTPVGAPIGGFGGPFDFGLQTLDGPYGIIANPGTACAATMSGTVDIIVNPLPTAYLVTGGGSYCSGGAGVHIYLSASAIGFNYQLYNGASPVGSPIAGTSSSIDFGLVTTTGSYTVVGTNTTTGCTGIMSGSATVSTMPTPTVFSVTGGGGYCIGGAGVLVGLNGSSVGISYQLYFGGVPSGLPLAGTGSALSFGLQTAAGSYTIVATNTITGCTSNMSGTATVMINTLPTVFSLTGGGNYCAGGTGVNISLNGSTIGVNYQLFRGLTAVGAPMAGTGVSLSFGLQTIAGTYTIVATNATTGCISNMSGSAVVAINPLPTVFSVTGGGGYCAGGTGLHVGLSGSVTATNYQLFISGTLVGAASGTGGAIDFGLFTTAGTYTVVATTISTGCTANMSGSATISVNALPTNTYSITGGGNYCTGGTGVVIGLSGSQALISYQLYTGGSVSGSPVLGTGSAISFGLRTVAGTYTVVATNLLTTCTSNIPGTVTIGINPLPTVQTVTGGGGYCAGGSGLPVALTSSVAGTNYQLFRGVLPVGSALPGTGSPISFGSQTVAGTYTVVVTTPATACSTTMAGSAVITVNPLPVAYTVSGSGSYCAGGPGVDLSLSNSASDVNYQLLVSGAPVGIPITGTGTLLDLGFNTLPGTYTVLATNTTTGCANNMAGSATVMIDALPAIFSVTGGGIYCTGGTGVNIGLDASASGVSYQLYNGLLTVGAPITGTGGVLDFGTQTAPGTYTVIATNPTSTCTNNMSGSVTISLNPQPNLYTVTGGGNFCTGGTGVHVGLSNSQTGINYQVLIGGVPSGPPVSGTGFTLDLGLMTAGGIYTVVATDIATGCTRTMIGSATIVVNPLPTIYTVLGGGNYCPGGTGVHVTTSGSDIGTNYQLFNGVTPVGSPMPGIGSGLDFGLMTTPGNYIVMATTPSTLCSRLMTGSATIAIYPLPPVHTVTGGGGYCAGGTGVSIGLSTSTPGVYYQLFQDTTAIGAPQSGTGLALDFGLQVAPGNYTVVATGALSGCTNNMSGSANVNINPLPNAHNVGGGGNYCDGSGGVHVGLDGSEGGIGYQLYNGITTVGSPFSGTGLPLDFGAQTDAGVYLVIATNTTTSCTNTMSGSVNVTIDPLPNSYIITGGGNYCTGGTGVSIGLSNSEPGVTYQLYNGFTIVGSPMAGSGTSLDFGLQTMPGTYTIVATNTATSCTKMMTGSVTITVSPIPTAYTVSGTGTYCTGGAGLHVLLSGSNTGITYQLYNGIIAVASLPGTGSGLDFGLQTATGVYTVIATNDITACTNTMSGSATINTTPLPVTYLVTGGGNYCSGGTGIHIGLSGSETGVNYQLYNGLSAIGGPTAGTGTSIDFGSILAAGNYTVKATNSTTGCNRTMTGSANITVNPLPAAYAVTGGGSYCSGGTGVHIGLSGSDPGASYQLLKGGMPFGGPVTGVGSPIDFGSYTTAGSYTVVAINPTTTCSNNMAGATTVSINSIPAVFTVTGGGSYCIGGPGVHVGLSGSSSSIRYQLYRGIVPVGSYIAGTGAALDFGLQTVAGNYTVVATNTFTACTANMTGSALVAVNDLPFAYSLTGGGNFCAGGSGVHVGITGSQTGVTYQLFNGTVAIGAPAGGTGSSIDFGLEASAGTYTVVGTNSSSGCIMNMAGSSLIVVDPLPIAYSLTGGGSYCAGGSGVHIGLSGSSAGVNYQLYDGFSAVGGPISGTGGSLDLGMQTATGTYTAIGTNSTTTCAENMAGSTSVTINPIAPASVGISTGSGDTVCGGTFVTLSAVPVNGGTAPTYHWQINGATVGTNTSYSYIPTAGDVVVLQMTSNAICAAPVLSTTSKALTVAPNEFPTVIVIADPGSNVCQGTTVTYTANAYFGGNNPTYTWTKNGVVAGTSSTLSYAPTNGDNIYCTITSDYQCRLSNSGTSDHILMQVNIPTTPAVTVTSANGTDIVPGQTLLLTATVSNAGPTPVYQWLINGTVVPGASAANFASSNFADGDVVSCKVISSGACSGIEGSGSVTIHVHPVGVAQVNSTHNNIALAPNPSRGTFTIKGSVDQKTDELTMEITDMLGKVIYTGKIKPKNGAINESLQLNEAIANGMYILSLLSATDVHLFHIVIER